MSSFNVRDTDLRAVNSMTKYPSIPTYHTLDPRDGGLLDGTVPFTGRVSLTEKVDGCLPYTTRITMADGTRRTLSSIRVGDEVLGVDRSGSIVATAVLQTFNNGRAETWMRIKGRRLAAGRGNAFFSVTCTPNHRFWLPDRSEYVSADKLAAGDKLLVLRSELDLSPCQFSVLLGKLLGDGYLHRAASGNSAVVWGHRQSDADYVAWTQRAIGDLASNAVRILSSGYGSTIVSARSTFHPCITEHFGGMTESGRKRVPEWVADALDPIALAFWYMDDGSLTTSPNQEDRAAFSTNGFDEDDCDVLLRGLKRLGIIAEVMHDGRGYLTLRLNVAAAERMFLLVAPYIPPSMQRKLPERYRGHEGWLPPPGSKFKAPLVPQVIEEIEYDVVGVTSNRHDIETGTHNFFANGILVHNSNGRIVSLPDGNYLIGSREELLHARGDLIANPALGIVDALRPIAERLPPVDGDRIVVRYLEVYGGKVTGASKHYTASRTVGARLFDVAVVDDYAELLDWPAQQLSSWRESGGQRFLDESALLSTAGVDGLEIVPRLDVLEAADLPTDLDKTYQLLREYLPQTRVALDGPPGRAEGIVLRSATRSAIAKARFQDYERTLKRRGAR